MIEFILDTLLLLPVLFVTYLVLEAVEAHAGGALEKFLERSRSVGPLAGGIAGAVPQCGFSAAAASFYAGGVISVGTLIAVFLSTSDELLPVLISTGSVPAGIMAKIVLIKVVAAIAVGFTINGILLFVRHFRRKVSVEELCEHSHCSCHEHKGIVIPALIHTFEILFFVAIVSGAVELALHFGGEEALERLCLDRPFVGELVGGLLGLVPNCAASVTGAKLYAAGLMSPAALMASSFSGCGLGLLILFRTNRNLKENLCILTAVYVIAVILGSLTGCLIGAVP